MVDTNLNITPAIVVAAPVVAPTPAPQPSETKPAAAAPPSPEPPAATPKADSLAAEMAKAVPSVIGEAEKPKPVEVKPAEPKTPDPSEAKTPEPVVQPAPLEPIVYKEFTLPKDVTVEQLPGMEAFKTVLGQHRASQDLGQALVDFYVKEVQDAIKTQDKVWKDTNDAWRAAALADPEIGGNRSETVLHSVAGLISEFGGSKEQQNEFRQVMNYTGAGNHPSVIRLMSRIAKALGEHGPVPAPTPKSSPQTTSRAERRYGKMNGAGQGT